MAKDRAMLRRFTDCQRVNPYSGWDIPCLNKLEHVVLKFLVKEVEDENVRRMLNAFLSCRTALPYKGWSVGKLNEIADEARAYLGLPSILELNPDLARIVETAVRNSETIRSLVPGRGSEPTGNSTREKTREEMVISQFRDLTAESQARVLKIIQEIQPTPD